MNKIFISMLTGIAIGILIAPAKGSETRRRLVNRFNDFTEDLSEEADDIHENAKNLINKVKSDVQDLAADLENITEPV